MAVVISSDLNRCETSENVNIMTSDIVKELTLVVADEEILAGQAHEDEGDPEPDRGPAPRLVSNHGYFERSRDEERRRVTR